MPYYPPQTLSMPQSATAAVAADTSTTSATWVDLLTINMTTGANFLLVQASAALLCSNASSRTMGLRLIVDGVAQRSVTAPSLSTTIASPFAIAHRMAITAAAHTIKLQWQVATGYTLSCNPVSAPDVCHCSLVAEEVLV